MVISGFATVTQRKLLGAKTSIIVIKNTTNSEDNVGLILCLWRKLRNKTIFAATHLK